MNPSDMLADLDPIANVTVPSDLAPPEPPAAAEPLELAELPEPPELQAARAAMSTAPILPARAGRRTPDFFVRAISYPPRTTAKGRVPPERHPARAATA